MKNETHLQIDLCGVDPIDMRRLVLAATRALVAYAANKGDQAIIDAQAARLDEATNELKTAVDENTPPKG